MPLPIKDYALISDTHTGAMVGIDGSIDWLCMPRFDSASIFGGLLGTDEQGSWRLFPVGADRATSRHYLEHTWVLVTRWVTDEGEVEVLDFMPHGGRRADVVRRVRGVKGTVKMRQELRFRFDYAAALPWLRQEPRKGEKDATSTTLVAVAGPDAVVVTGPHFSPEDLVHVAEYEVSEGEVFDTSLTWYPAHRVTPERADVDELLKITTEWWQNWAGRAGADGPFSEELVRSLLALRALTHEDTGGIVAAATTSLPEDPGGERNWDYRYVWLRDASMTLGALVENGYTKIAEEWRGWLLRAIAGDPADVQIMYGLAGERRLPEWDVPTLPGYDGASPVRIGNAASKQFQGDVFGEVMVAFEQSRSAGVEENRFSWSLQAALLEFAAKNLDRPDSGIWEMRGPEQYFTHSRVSLWAAFDSGIRGIEAHGLDGPLEEWKRIRGDLHDEIEARGFDEKRNSYRQHYNTDAVDASLLMLPTLGYLPFDHPRMLGTVAAIEHDLMKDGMLLRYLPQSGIDGLKGTENPFVACSFWLAHQYAGSGRLDDSRELMTRVIGMANDVGLFSEELDPKTGAHWGNFPQALSHLAMVRAAAALRDATDPAEQKAAEARGADGAAPKADAADAKAADAKGHGGKAHGGHHGKG